MLWLCVVTASLIGVIACSIILSISVRISTLTSALTSALNDNLVGLDGGIMFSVSMREYLGECQRELTEAVVQMTMYPGLA